MPISTESIVVPSWFRTSATHLGSHQVLLVLPAPFSTISGAMIWQAESGLSFSMVAGAGPGVAVIDDGPNHEAALALGNVSYPFGYGSLITSADVTAVRRAIESWRVTMVVIPDQTGLPIYDRTQLPNLAAALLTAALRVPPIHSSGAWIWKVPPTIRSLRSVSTTVIAACAQSAAGSATLGMRISSQCILKD